MSDYTERDLNDMDEKMNVLKDTAFLLDGMINDAYVEVMENVVEEWGCTREHLLSLISIEEKES